MSEPPRRAPPADWYVENVAVGRHSIPMKQLSFGDVLAASAEGDREPWWAHVWPAGLLLAEHVLDGPRLDGQRVLDLGTGAGVVGIAAALKGAEVTFSDLLPDALELAAENAGRSGLHDFHLLELDWRVPPNERFDLVLAADVIYDPTQLEALAEALASLTAPGGSALLSDPRRPHLPEFLRALPAAGLTSEIVDDGEAGLLLRLQHAH